MFSFLLGSLKPLKWAYHQKLFSCVWGCSSKVVVLSLSKESRLGPDSQAGQK